MLLIPFESPLDSSGGLAFLRFEGLDELFAGDTHGASAGFCRSFGALSCAGPDELEASECCSGMACSATILFVCRGELRKGNRDGAKVCM